MRDAAGREAGDTVRVRLVRDNASRVLATPPDLARALRGAGRMKQFVAETPSRRKEIIRWVCGTRNAATRQRRIGQAVGHFNNRRQPVAHRRGR